jgi:hypothetical protein
MVLGVRNLIVSISLTLLLGGCAPKLAEVDADRMGRMIIDAIQRDDWPVIDANLSPAMAQDPLHAPKIAELRKQFPTEPPWSIKLLASSKEESATPERSTLKYLYTFAERKLVIDLTVEHYGWRKMYEPITPRTGAAVPDAGGSVVFDKPPKPRADERAYRVLELYKLSAISVAPAPGKGTRSWAHPTAESEILIWP